MAKGILNLRWSFNFIEKDPEIDKFRTLYQKQRIKEDDLAAIAGLATTTVKNMFGGHTRRPQHLTYSKLAAAMGHEYGLIEVQRPDYEAEIAVAKQERKEHRLAMKKRREKAERRTAKKRS